MKKHIFLLALGLILATAAHAETTIEWTQAGCQSVGGTWITAHNATDEGCDANHCNGLNFCEKQVYMTWFGALIWCKSIGRKLADLETACPNGLSSGGTCANLAGKIGNVWSNMPSTNNKSYIIQGANGRISVKAREGERNPPGALCQ
ncbi:MAG: hypothetical protein J6Y85_05750 [Alphaproteobacteria bacterium]|nr:hypothetical protein [Alphaproteobacteria bacterium]